jgi:glycosyltransferase involved in cell wall biosynthesis
VVPCYNRRKSLQRLLDTINRAVYPFDIHLIISVDGGATGDVVELAQSFRFKGGSVEVIQHGSHLGLRNHIVWCGDLSKEFGSVIVLEDDLIVDRQFYSYTVAALQHYSMDKSVSGIALYAQRYNQYTNLPFEPLQNGKSTYFMQIGCSSGQAWSAARWSEFRSWYDSVNESVVLDCKGIPDTVKRWPESSWKKYYHAYLVETNKYVVYPYQSYTSNCGDYPGEHVRGDSNRFHVPFRDSKRSADVLVFAELGSNDIHYDAFMEPSGAGFFERLGIGQKDVTVDLHGHKPDALVLSKPYVITCREINSTPIRSFPMRFRPIEMNLDFESSPSGTLFLRLYKLEPDSEVRPLSKREYFELVRFHSYYEIGHKDQLTGYFLHYLRNVRLRIRKKLF